MLTRNLGLGSGDLHQGSAGGHHVDNPLCTCLLVVYPTQSSLLQQICSLKDDDDDADGWMEAGLSFDDLQPLIFDSRLKKAVTLTFKASNNTITPFGAT